MLSVRCFCAVQATLQYEDVKIKNLSKDDFLETFPSGTTVSIFVMGLTSGSPCNAMSMMEGATEGIGDRHSLLFLWPAGNNVLAYDWALRAVPAAGLALNHLCSILAGKVIRCFRHSWSELEPQVLHVVQLYCTIQDKWQ